jgi:hypothetical protein
MIMPEEEYPYPIDVSYREMPQRIRLLHSDGTVEVVDMKEDEEEDG